MPVLEHPSEKIRLTLPPRTAQLAGSTDVLVVGGGPAGIGAAIGAADAGADVILTERFSFLGGNATAALVMPLMSFHTQQYTKEKTGDTSFLPTDHGKGDPVVSGVLEKFLQKLIVSGGAISPSIQTGYVVPFDPEIFKITAIEMLDEYKVKFLLHSFASGLFDSGKEKGVIFETKSGPVVITAKIIVDCTGDGDIASVAGAEYEIGRKLDDLVQPMTLMFRLVEFERTAFDNYVKEHPDQWRGVHGLWDLIKKAAMAGELDLAREDLLMFGTPHEHELSVNSTRITKALGTDVWDLTYAEWEGRRQMKQIISFLKRYVPGFEKSYIVQSGTTVGVRETRRIIGNYYLTADDILEAKKFDDAIARCSYPIDVHNPKGKGTILKRLPPGEAYDIPLRCLIPKDIKNILTAGRCISGTHEAHSSYRVMPTAMATGQAAGVCAAISALRKTTPENILHDDVQKELLKQGAIINKVS